MQEAGRLLKDTHPNRTIERDLFHRAAGFSRTQADEGTEASLQVDRGLLVVGRLLGDTDLIAEAIRRLQNLGERSFTYDGLWRGGDPAAHARVLGLLDGWISCLLDAGGDSIALAIGVEGGTKPTTRRTALDRLPILALARHAGESARLAAPDAPEVVAASWPAATAATREARPGASWEAQVWPAWASARGPMRSMSNSGEWVRSVPGPTPTGHDGRRSGSRSGGRVLLGDQDDTPRPDGFDRASASHNTVIVNDLNQRETSRMLHEAAPGGSFVFFAADPDFQVAVQNDPYAYPKLISAPDGYRQTVVVASGPKTRYAVTVFQVHGGARHDQFWHGPPPSSAGGDGRWVVSLAMPNSIRSLLDPAVPFVASPLSAADGRWFVQSYGMFRRDPPGGGPASRASPSGMRGGGPTSGSTSLTSHRFRS